MMTGRQVAAARKTLGFRWGLNRSLKPVELGLLLHLHSPKPGNSVHNWERGHSQISGPASRAIEAMLDGWIPNDRDKHLGSADE